MKRINFIAVSILILFTQGANSAFAQALNPSAWQQNATGLKTSSNTAKKTAGLTTIVNASGIPTVVLQGGVSTSGNGPYGRLIGPTGINLGQINIAGTTPTLTSESADWAHNEMTFSNNLKIWVSRLSPAVLLQNNNVSLRLFAGNLGGLVFTTNAQGQTVGTNRVPAPSYPKYVAYQSGGIIQVRFIPASTSAVLSLPTLDNGWVLVWYGNNSHFVDTKAPIAYSNNGGYASSTLPYNQGYQADAPLLLKFENNPLSIINSAEGGIDLGFGVNSGYVSILPLFGREHLKASDTEGWGASGALPADVVQKLNFWVPRLSSYPVTVSESYAYDSVSDTTIISENITFLAVGNTGSGGTRFSILPPMLAIAKDAFGAGFSVSGGALVDADYPTEFGPILGLDNVNTYSWRVSGLKKYTDKKRIMADTGNVPIELTQELDAEVQKIIAAGHFAPWIFVDSLSTRDSNGDIYFLNPADNIYHLAEIAFALPPSQLKTDLISYISAERNSFPPETIYNLSSLGLIRRAFAVDNNRPSENRSLTMYNYLKSLRPDIFAQRTPLYNFYSLSKYYELTSDAIPVSALTQAKAVLDADMAEQDWSTFFWFKSFTPKRIAVIGSSRHLAGIIGFVKLSKAIGDAQSEDLGRALLAKAAIQRLAMAKYPRYLYSVGLTALPTPLNPAWQPNFTADSWRGYIFNYDWTGPFDDPLQVVLLDQFGVYLNDSSGFGEPNTGGRDWSYVTSGHLVGYRDLVPEAARFLTDFARQDIEIYLDKAEAFAPNWYVAFSEGVVGQEHNLSHPIDSFQLFMAKALIVRDTPQNLDKYADISWLDSGDFFYMHKLAETIKAYQGWRWEDEVANTGAPADINGDSSVDVLDIQACVNHILGVQDLGTRADVNSDGSVDVLDVQNIVNIILGA